MFTSMDKALVAAIMAIISIVNLVWGYQLGWNEEMVGIIVAALFPILVYLWPNLRTDH